MISFDATEACIVHIQKWVAFFNGVNILISTRRLKAWLKESPDVI